MAIAELVLGGACLYRMGVSSEQYPAPSVEVGVGIAIALAPVVLWIAFVSWRGTLLPAYDHDALAYHLPKAVMLAKAGGYRVFDVPEARIATWPCDYELLLADSLILTGGDAATASVSTLAYGVLVLMAAWIAAAWWGPGLHVAVAAAFVATTPLVILHSGLHKNDLLLSVFATGAFAWAGQWFARGCRASGVLACLALLLAAGTKASAAFPVAATVPVLALGVYRHRAALRAWPVAAFAVGGAVLAVLLGGVTYLANLAVLHRLIAAPPYQSGYGDWSSIWQFTTMLVIAPFSPLASAVWNPFRGEYWWWPANDVWISHFGALFSILAVALVPCVWLYARRGSDRAERAAASASALAAYLLTLPIQGRPFGFFAGEGRYVFFVLPFVAGWTLCPMIVQVLSFANRARLSRVAVPIAMGLAMAAYGAVAIWQFGVHDAYAPIEWVIDVFHHPDDRRPFVRRDRAATAFDAVAGPEEVCAFDVYYDTWVYPAYGRGWTRKVEFLKPSAGDVVIPDDVRWVLVDRSWNIFFGHPKFVDMGKAQYLGRGRPTDDDVKVYRQLRSDPRFELVYDERRYNQAVFHRIEPAAAPTPESGR